MSAPATGREAALRRIAELASSHGLSLDDIAAALAGPDAAVAARRPAVLTRLFAYVGGVFVFAGIGIFIAMQWGDMTPAARVVVTLGSGVAAFGMALAAIKDARFAGAVTPLFLIAAILEPVGLFVALDEYGAGDNWRHASLVVNGAMLAQQALVFVALRRTALLFGAMAFGAAFVATLLDVVGVDEDLTVATVGASLLFLTVGVQRTPHAPITPLWYLVSSGLLLWGLFELLRGTVVEPLYLGVACGLVYLSTHVRSRSVLIAATVAMLGYIGYFTGRHFVDTVGWPLALIAFGLAMLGLSAAAVAINRRYIKAPG
jgi:hypothetical protein